MRLTNEKIYISVLGYGLGALVGWYTTKTYYQKKAEEEIESVKKIYNQKPDHKKFVEEMAKMEVEKNKIVDREMAKIKEENEAVMTDYSRISKSYSPSKLDNVPEEVPENSLNDDYTVKGEDVEIEYGIVSVDSFQNDYPEFDKISLTYYEELDILFDDRDQAIDDPDLIDYQALKFFGYLSEDPQIVYVRNLNREADYEIIRKSGYPGISE